MGKMQVIQKLDQQVREAGGIRAWSRANEYTRTNPTTGKKETRGFSASYISEVLNGNIPPSKNLAALLGFEAVITYRPMKTAA
ncbi:MAG TPA: hypothetical protein VHT52_24270 [Stellaceae bacterium]|jgi:hypothetical protein|nr:hypothetical protein [Stellaceae bacterium]